MEFDGGVRPPVSTKEHQQIREHSARPTVSVEHVGTKKARPSQASQSMRLCNPSPHAEDHLALRLKISQGDFVWCVWQARNISACNTSTEGLAPGTIVELHHEDKPRDRWYMKITDGRVRGPPDDPYLAGAQWMKSNSRKSPELPIQTTICHIKTIIAQFTND
jgi:hypothetical protein